MKALLATLLLALALQASGCPLKDEVINSPLRSDAAKARDSYRHPCDTLAFFGFRPDMTVVEIWPGGGWYSDLLAPALTAGGGKLYAAHFNPDSPSGYFRKALARYRQKLQRPDYASVELTVFEPFGKQPIAPAASADLVLTFRNVHNWYMQGGEAAIVDAFRQFHKALKTGGILGVIEHRLPESADQKTFANSGYMKQSLVIQLAEQAGFRLLESSEINANPKDTANHPKGVWTLPPTLRLGDQDREKYLAIGESDRMTLKFRKVSTTSE